jgi:putative phosphoribosyl transferase
MVFRDRAHAGQLLASVLKQRSFHQPVVLALPRGGVPVACPIADALRAPLDLVMVRKIGVPWQPELAAAAVTDGKWPEIALNEEVMRFANLTRDTIEQLAVPELREIERRRRLYLRNRSPIDIHGRDAIVVDDGMATGATFKTAIKAIRLRSPRRIIGAVPVASAEAISELRTLVDDLVCLLIPPELSSVGASYEDFSQLTDDEVIQLLSTGADAPRSPVDGG